MPFKFQVNYHSFGPWLLYPQGWQIGTPTADDPIFYALSGNRDNPAIEGFAPGLSSDVLYVTNGEMTDWANSAVGTIAWTPELEPGCPTCGFVFPDNEALVQAEFQKNLPFVLDVAKSAPDPAHPVSHLGLTPRPLVVKSDDTYKAGLPMANFTFPYSYGDPQEVRVDALRSVGAVSVKYQINGGPVQTAPTDELPPGSKYSASSSTYYHVMHGDVTGTKPGDSVKVWFEGGGATSDSFTYQAVNESDHDTLVVASEDYSGASPVQTPGPHYASYYLDALAANGVNADLYDVDASGRHAADALGVLSHYKAVIVEKGDDIVTREPGWGGGNASRIAQDEVFELRDFMNEGGKVLFAGKDIGTQYTQAQLYDPTDANGRCGDPAVTYRCLQLNGTGDGVNDVLQYWFGSFLFNRGAGVNDDGDIFDANGTDDPLTGPELVVQRHGQRPEPQHRRLVHRDERDPAGGDLPAVRQLGGGEVRPARRAVRPAFGHALRVLADRGPVVQAAGPHGQRPGRRGRHDVLDVLQHGVRLGSPLRRGPHRGAGRLDDPGGPERQQRPDDGRKLQALERAGRLAHDPPVHGSLPDDRHRQRHVRARTGRRGDWWGISGNSGDWQQWHVDLSAFAGKQIEVSITYVSDWATQGLGVFVDDIVVSTGEGTTSFESGDDGWQMPDAPAGSAPNFNTWEITSAGGFPEGAVIATPSSLLWGFGLEGVTDEGVRDELMGRAIDFLRS